MVKPGRHALDEIFSKVQPKDSKQIHLIAVNELTISSSQSLESRHYEHDLSISCPLEPDEWVHLVDTPSEVRYSRLGTVFASYPLRDLSISYEAYLTLLLLG